MKKGFFADIAGAWDSFLNHMVKNLGNSGDGFSVFWLKAGWKERVIAYFGLFIATSLVMLVIFVVSDRPMLNVMRFYGVQTLWDLKTTATQTQVLLVNVTLIFFYFAPGLFLIWWKEWTLRRFKKILGDQTAINMYIIKKLTNKNGENKMDKNDLSYWYDMYQKGAINEHEYNIKKTELLK